MVPYAGNGFGLSLRCLGRLLPVLGEFLLLRNSQSPGPGPSGPSLLHATGGLKRSYRSASGPPAPRATSTADLLPEAVKAALEVGGGFGPRSSRRKSARPAAATHSPGVPPSPTRRRRRRRSGPAARACRGSRPGHHGFAAATCGARPQQARSTPCAALPARSPHFNIMPGVPAPFRTAAQRAPGAQPGKPRTSRGAS